MGLTNCKIYTILILKDSQLEAIEPRYIATPEDVQSYRLLIGAL